MSDTGFGGSTSSPFPSGSGHNAGWEWAKKQGLTSDSDVQGGGSFHEGARAYVESLKTENDSGS